MNQSTIRILGISGSTRPGSLNRSLLTVAQTHLPKNSTLTIFDVSALPLYCASKELNFPEEAMRLKAALADVDAVLFAATEHNFSISAGLKNAIDWGSRPLGANSWANKPAAIFGATPSTVGTARAQYHLRQILVGLNMPTVNLPEVFVANARDRLDADGNLNDPDAHILIAKLLSNLVELVKQRHTRPTTLNE